MTKKSNKTALNNIMGFCTGGGLTILAKLAYLLIAFSPVGLYVLGTCEFFGCIFVFICVLGAGILLGIFSMFQKSNKVFHVFAYVFLHGFLSAILVFALLLALV